MANDDDFNTYTVGSFASGAVGPLMRARGGAARAANERRLVYVLAILGAVIPFAGLAFAFIALLVALLDALSGRRGAGLEVLASLASIAVASTITYLVLR
jgi:hypothetical protein